MNRLKMKPVAVLVLLGVVFQACNEDEVTSDALAIEASDTFSDSEDLQSFVTVEWVDLYLELERYSAGRPNAAARGIAYIFLSSYETLQPSLEGYRSLSNELRGFDLDQDPDASVNYELALSTSYAAVLEHFLLDLDASLLQEVEALKVLMEAYMTSSLSEEEVATSIAWGQYVASEVISYSQTDEAAEVQVLDPQPLSYEPPVGDGFWTYSADPERALFPYWEEVRTFVASTKETSTLTPIDYSEAPDSEYFAQMQEVYEINTLPESIRMNSYGSRSFGAMMSRD